MRVTLGRTLTGPAGTATEQFVEDPPAHTATVAAWFLDCPGQSPAWRHYGLSVIHLRPIEGMQSPVINIPGATHEVLLLAFDPQGSPVADDPETWSFLTPINVSEQIQLPSDEKAVKLLEQAARAVVDGILWAEPPLSGQVEPWRTSLIKTAAHARGEVHAS